MTELIANPSRTRSSDMRVHAALLTLTATYLLLGMIGHDPWKQDEAYIFGIVLSLLQSGDWVVPTLAGEPFMEKPPLYYLVAAITSLTFKDALPLHDGARLASALFNAITLTAVAAAAKRLWGSGYGWTAVFCFIGCFGFLLHSRMMLTDLAMLSGFALSYLGLLQSLSSRLSAALLFGTGAGIAFLGKGLIGPGALGLTALSLFAMREFRNAQYGRFLFTALLAALPWITIWPAALYGRSPALFDEWFWQNNVGRFFGYSVARLGAEHTPWFWSYTLPWFTFPAWPLAIGALMRLRGAQYSIEIKITLLLAASVLAPLWLSASAREMYALPLLVPLSALAAGGVTMITHRADRFLALGAIALLGSVAFALSYLWTANALSMSAPGLTWLGQLIPLDLDVRHSAVAVPMVATILAAATTVIASQQRHAAIPQSLLAWVAVLTFTLTTLFGLWMPWLDAAKGYRATFLTMAAHLPSGGTQCVSSIGLGESERAMLHYVAGVKAVQLEVRPEAECNALLIQDHVGDTLTSPNELWRFVWQGGRPADQRERFRLYVRADYTARNTREDIKPVAAIPYRASVARARNPISIFTDSRKR